MFKDVELRQNFYITNQFINKQPGTALSGDPVDLNSQPSEAIVF